MADEITDGDRIRNIVRAYLDASSEYNHLSHKADNAKAVMDRAVRDLRFLNGVDALRKLGVVVP